MTAVKPVRWWMLPVKAAKVLLDEARELFVFFIIKWPSTSLGFRARRMYWRRKTGVKNIVVARGATVSDCSLIEFGDNLEIGENVEIVVGGGDAHKVYIGSNIYFARGVYLRSANHRFDDPDKLIMHQGHTSRSLKYRDSEYAVVIESDAWIGANAIILSGAWIGEGCVIGAGSVVAGVIPPYSVAAGCPARVISSRKRFASPVIASGS